MKSSSTITLVDGHRVRILAMREKHGIYQTANLLGISRQAIDRAIGGLAIHKGTAAFISQQIAKRDADGKYP